MIRLLDVRYTAFRQLCWSLAILMFVAPALPVLAQESSPDSALGARRNAGSKPFLLTDPAKGTAQLDFVLPQSCLVMSLRPQQVLNSEMARLYPIEVVQAAALEHVGLDPLQLEHVVASVEPPMAGPPNYAVVASFNAEVGALNPQLTAHTQPAQVEGQDYLQSLNPFMPSIYVMKGKTLLAAPDMTIQKFARGPATPEPSLLLKRLATSSHDDAYAAMDLQPLRPLINQLLMQQQREIPPEFNFLLGLPDLIRLVELRLNVTGKGPSELVVQANNEQDADKILAILEEASQIWIDQILAETEQFKLKEDPVERALGSYLERITGDVQSEFMPQREGSRLVIFRVEGDGNAASMTSIATIGMLVGLLLPAVQAAREAARRTTSMNNMKQIMLAMLVHHDALESFPAYANFDASGKPLLSWRVHILPYIEHQALYDQFHLDEPWDSPHNKTLIPQMPIIYIDPSSPLEVTAGKTHYLGAKGKGLFFDPDEPNVSLREITDGSSNTIAVVQVGDQSAVTWTKPEDWEYDEKKPLQGLVPNVHPEIFLVGIADGSVHNVSQSIDPATLKKLLTRAGGEAIDHRELNLR